MDRNDNLVDPKQRGFFDRLMRRVFGGEDLHPKDGTMNPRAVCREYAAVVWKHPFALATITVAAMCDRALYILSPLALKDLVDHLGGKTPSWETAMGILLWYTTIFLLTWVCARVAVFGLCITTPGIIAELKKRGLRYTLRHNHRFFVKTFVGALGKRIERFGDRYDTLTDRIVFDILPLIVQLVGTLIVLAAAGPVMAFALILGIGVAIAANASFVRWKAPYEVARAAHDSRTTGVIVDTVTNHHAVTTHAGYDDAERRCAAAIDRQAKWRRFSWQTGAAFEAFQGLTVRVLEIGILALGIREFFAGNVTVGTIIMAQIYARAIGDQTWTLTRIFRELYEVFADGKEMTDILAIPHEIADPKASPASPEAHGAVTFDNVVFSYNGKQRILDGMSFTVRPGERLGVVGPSGAGKSTLVRLLERNYDPTSGAVLVDGIDARTFSIADLRGRFAIVQQDTILFHESLMANIRYGRKTATDEEVVAAAKLAQAHEFITATAKGYDTLVGERGIMLSGGQRQRIAIARAILRNAPILVLDEATSSLDTESERAIQSALGPLMEGRTTIAIAHRLSTLERMDRIIVLGGGRIVEEGSHEKLLALDGHYARVWRLQKDGFLPEEDGNEPDEIETGDEVLDGSPA